MIVSPRRGAHRAPRQTRSRATGPCSRCRGGQHQEPADYGRRCRRGLPRTSLQATRIVVLRQRQGCASYVDRTRRCVTLAKPLYEPAVDARAIILRRFQESCPSRREREPSNRSLLGCRSATALAVGGRTLALGTARALARRQGALGRRIESACDIPC